MMNKLFKHYSDVPKGEWAWKDFAPRELASKGDGSLLVNSDAITKLQNLRNYLGIPLLITSAYRDPVHNKKVGGAKSSYHMKGMAFDVRMDNQDPTAFVKAAKAMGFTGIGYYERQGFIHIDIGPARTWGTPFKGSPATKLAVESEKKQSVTQSTTLRAVVTGAGATATTAATAIPQLSGTNQTVVIVAVVVIVLALGWIMRERIKKWVDGIR